jgi:hypothetical protein
MPRKSKRYHKRSSRSRHSRRTRRRSGGDGRLLERVRNFFSTSKDKDFWKKIDNININDYNAQVNEQNTTPNQAFENIENNNILECFNDKDRSVLFLKLNKCKDSNYKSKNETNKKRCETLQTIKDYQDYCLQKKLTNAENFTKSLNPKKQKKIEIKLKNTFPTKEDLLLERQLKQMEKEEEKRRNNFLRTQEEAKRVEDQLTQKEIENIFM